MKRPALSAAAALAFAIAGCNAAPNPGAIPAASSAEGGFYPMVGAAAAYPACPPVHRVHEWRCNAWVRTDLQPAGFSGDGIPNGIGYTPSDLQSAYGFNSKKGRGQTIVIVDAYGYPTAVADATKYRAAAQLPPCTPATGCLRILNQNGGASPLPPPPPSNLAGWLVEQSLDLDTVSAVCPHCKIVLIETQDGTTLSTGISTALRLGKIVSMSFGGSELGESPNPGLPASGYALVASAGDSGGGTNGGGPQVPCTWTAIICVGGTKLTHVGGVWKSVVWNDERIYQCGGPCGATGSGCSSIVAKPSWQHDAGCTMRSETDISADAGVTTPFAVYNSTIFRGSHWAGVGGTSLATPMIAAMIALAGNATSRHGAMEIWQLHDSVTNVVRGSNLYGAVTGPCASSVRYICIAGPGYNGPTGWGSPNGLSDL